MSAPRYSWRRYKVSPSICVGVQLRSQVFRERREGKASCSPIFFFELRCRRVKFIFKEIGMYFDIDGVENVSNENHATLLFYKKLINIPKRFN